ncbi:MAG: hypothetical protein U1F36_02235 [Planctomycetota bacterium]
MHAALAVALILLLPMHALAQERGQDDALRLTQLKREWRCVHEADAVVLAHLDHLERSPGIWCGIVVTRQIAVWRVDEVVCGAKLEGEIRVGHLLVANSPLVDPHEPFLRPELFFQGARALLCAVREGEHLAVRDESFGVKLIDAARSADPDVAAIVRAAVDHESLRTWLRGAPDEPLRTCIELGPHLPIPIAATVQGRAIPCVPPELVRDRKALRITRCKVDGDRAEIAGEVTREGVHFVFGFARQDRVWSVVRSEVGER